MQIPPERTPNLSPPMPPPIPTGSHTPPSRHSIEVDVHASVGIVRPGDKLVVAVDRPLDMHTMHVIRERLEAHLPGVEVVPIEARSLAVYRS